MDIFSIKYEVIITVMSLTSFFFYYCISSKLKFGVTDWKFSKIGMNHCFLREGYSRVPPYGDLQIKL